MHLLVFIFVAIIRSATLSAACPHLFSRSYHEGCFTYAGRSNSFCEAAEKCVRLGKGVNAITYLVGRNSPKVLGSTMQFWTGVNQLLVFRNKTRSGWYDVNPHKPEYTTGSDIQWEETPSDERGPVTFYKQADKSFHEKPTLLSTDRLSVVCEYGSRFATTIAKTKFQSNFPVHLDKLIQPNPNLKGCFAGILTQVTRIECAFACARNFACRSVYYNELSDECFRTMYADSLLAGNLTKLENGWTRFAKTAIPIFRVRLNGDN
ncbi:hypothetical protein EG68_07370 [Paragonimus skrjabini miyazakii]|uniref:Apple domain-containing protein n=1 Tax=Paragonimus skrjabini miyazakii TaxID=59628 RepID=A0A8S9YSW5_9TREM|nr:hypothetical protein EG68_07370 [Paragonimus skrjabini miyazakii]